MRILLLTILIILQQGLASAYDLANFKHVPPLVNIEKPMLLEIPAQGLKRARVLIADKTGYTVNEMKKSGNNFYTEVAFKDFAIIKYQFQLQSEQDEVLETQQYFLRQTSNAELENTIIDLNKQIETKNARILQLQNAIQGVKNSDPQSLAKRKSQELARAYLNLSQKERELAQLSSKLKSKVGK